MCLKNAGNFIKQHNDACARKERASRLPSVGRECVGKSSLMNRLLEKGPFHYYRHTGEQLGTRLKKD